jgi:hypothetical protein
VCMFVGTGLPRKGCLYSSFHTLRGHGDTQASGAISLFFSVFF